MIRKQNIKVDLRPYWNQSRNIFWKNLVCCLLVISCCFHGQAQHFQKVEELGLSQSPMHSTGLAVADYDRDGDLDIFIVASEVFDKENPDTWSRLLRNEGKQGFVDVTLSAGLINWEGRNSGWDHGVQDGGKLGRLRQRWLSGYVYF